jgi:hypothetical protein
MTETGFLRFIEIKMNYKESGSRGPGFGLLPAEPIVSDLALRASFFSVRIIEGA